MDPVILVSARKHGIHDDDMLHAYRYPIRVFELDDLTMLIGPTKPPDSSRSASRRPRASSSSFTP